MAEHLADGRLLIPHAENDIVIAGTYLHHKSWAVRALGCHGCAIGVEYTPLCLPHVGNCPGGWLKRDLQPIN
jgi:hypothetical protein